VYYAGQNFLAVIVCQLKKKMYSVLYYHHDYRLDYEVIFWVVNFKTQNYFVISSLILFIHVGFLEYLSFKQFKLIVKMTRIESGVTIPKGLFTLYLNVKKVTANIFWSP
jgi:hypothetical protein